MLHKNLVWCHIVMDFKGVGSSERTRQEDMLLSVFNASISNLTVFKCESMLAAPSENPLYLLFLSHSEQIDLTKICRRFSTTFNKE